MATEASTARPDAAEIRPAGRWRDPVALVGFAVIAVAAALAARRPWAGDFGMHAATVWRLREHLTDPGDPLVDADVDGPYFSPYTVLLALISRATGASPITLLWIAAPVNVAILLLGLRAWVRTFTASRLAPILALACLFGLWGTTTRAWSGYLSLWSLPLVMSYPSTLAFGLMLLAFAWASLLLDADRPEWWRYATFGLFVATIALIHQFTFVATALGLIATALPRLRHLTTRAWLGLGLSAAVMMAALLAWPYYSFFALLRVNNLDAIHRPLYDSPLSYYGFALAALPAMWLRIRRNRLDPLVWFFVLSSAVVAYGAASHHWAMGRVWPAVMLAAQVALAVELAPILQRLWSTARRGKDRSTARQQANSVDGWRGWVPVWAVASTAVIVTGLILHAGNLLFLGPRSTLTPQVRKAANVYTVWPDYSWLGSRVKPGEVVLTNDYFGQRTVIAYGAYTVAPAWPDPFLHDEAQRRADLSAMVAASTDAVTRRELFQKYHVTWVLETGRSTILADQHPVAVGPRGERLYHVG